MCRQILKTFINRNPRNLELMGLQAPATGYSLEIDRSRKCFIHRAQLVRSKAHLDATIIHYKNGVVLSASTREKQISAQIFSVRSVATALNLGRILALRCIMSGVLFVKKSDSEETIMANEHLKVFYEHLEEGGVTLTEPPHIEHNYLSDRNFKHERYIIKHDQLDYTD